MQLYEKVFGKYLDNAKKQGDNLVIPCLWHSDHKPSLSISTNPDKPVYQCWSCGKKGSLIGAYMELNNVDYKTALKELDMFDDNYKPQPVYVSLPEPVKHEKTVKDVDYSEYCYNAWTNTIMHNNHFAFYGKKLYELRGITYDTAVACCIGYDKNKGWIFPFSRLQDGKCTGYEIRQKEFKLFDFNKSKCYKAKDSESCLSVVWKGTSRKAVCCEGFIDSFFMYQYLHEKAQLKTKRITAQVEETIITPTNGVKTIPELVKAVELWKLFDEVLFVLDNDAASQPITEELKQFAKQNGYNFKFFNGLNEGEDFENWYKWRLKNEK